MDFMGTDLIDTLQEGELYALSSPLGGFYHAQRFLGRSLWEFPVHGDESPVNVAAVVELLKSDCGNYAGFRSHHAEGKVLQACRDKNVCLRFNNYNFDKWEQWSIYGNSLNKCLLVNRKFTDKQFEASFHKVLMVTELSLDTFLKKLKAKVQNEFMKGYGGRAEEQLHKFPSQIQHSASCTDGDASFSLGSKLYEIFQAFCMSVIMEVENKITSVQHMLIEKQAMEYESKLDSVQEKAQDLEMRLLHVQESMMMYRKKADEKIAALLNDLELAQMNAECAAADQSRFKLIEAESMKLSDELHSINSCVNEMRLQNKLAEEKAQKFASEATKLHGRICELEMLLNDAQLNVEKAEEKLLLWTDQHKGEIEAMSSREETLKKALQKADEELDLTRKRVSELEHDLRLATAREEEYLREPKIKRGQAMKSLPRLMDLQNGAEDTNIEKHSNVLANSRFQEIEIEKHGYQQAHTSGEKPIRDLEAELRDANLFIETFEKRSQAWDKNEMLEIVKSLEISEDEPKSNTEHVMSLQHELDKLKVGIYNTADAFKVAELKVVDWKSNWSDQESVFSQKCQELEDAVIRLSEKLVKLEKAYNMVHSEIQFAKTEVKILEIDKVKLESIIIELKEKVKDAEISHVNVVASNTNLMHRHSEIQDFLKGNEAENDEAAKHIMELEAALLQARHENFTLELAIKYAEEKCSKMNSRVKQMSEKLLETSKEKVKQFEESLQQIGNTLKQSEDGAAAEVEQLANNQADVEFVNKNDHGQTVTSRKKPVDLAGKIENVENSLCYHEKVIKQSLDRSRELESLIRTSQTEAKIATEKASCIEAMLAVAKENRNQSEMKVKDLTKELQLLDGEFKKVKIEAGITVVQLEKAEKRITGMLQLVDNLKEAEMLVSHLKERVSLAEGRASKAEANLHESSVKASTLRIELSNSEEVIENLQASLSEVEDHRHTLGAQIENVTRSFAELNKQLEHERQHLQVQVARMRQANDSLKGENGRLQEQLQESLSDARACSKKLKESLLWKAVLEKEVHNLKSQMKKSKLKSNPGDVFENVKERDLNVDSASGKSLRRKLKNAARDVKGPSATLQRVDEKNVYAHCSSSRSWIVLFLCTVLCTCLVIKFW